MIAWQDIPEALRAACLFNTDYVSSHILQVAGLGVISSWKPFEFGNRMNHHSSDSSADSVLLSSIAEHDEHALEQLYDRYAKLLYSVIFRIVRTQEDAENLLQDVFLQVWHHADSYDPRLGTPSTWMIRIARNKAIDLWRSKHYRGKTQRVQLEHAEEYADPSQSPLSTTIAGEASVLVKQALGRLPIDQKRLIELAYYEGYSQSELSEALSLPLGTVKSRMRLGLLSLRDQFKTLPELMNVNG